MKKFFAALASLVVIASSLLPLATFADSTNLIANSSMEQGAATAPTGWASDGWGTNTRSFSYVSTGHTGTKSVKTQITKYTTGDAKWYFTPVTVKPNTSYTYTDWYQSSVASSVDVVVKTTAKTTKYVWQGDPSASSAWKQASYTFKTPSNAATVTVYHYIEKVGQITLDDASLVENGVTTTPTAPTVSISSPAANTTVSGTVSVNATASDTQGVSSVQFKLDGANLGSADTTSPYSVNWDTTKTANGAHSLTATATNMSNLSTTSTAINVNVQNVVPTPPTVSIVTPGANATVSSTTSISANASDSLGVSSVQFKLDGANLGAADTTSPYSLSWDTTTTTNGSHTLTAVATNTSNLSTTSAAVTVNVQNQVVITPPPAPAPTNLIANPSVETSTNNVPDSWLDGSWGTNTYALSYVSGGHTGTHSLKTQITSYTNGDAKWYFNPVTVTGGKSYSYSNYYLSNIDSELDAMVTMSDGSVQWLYLTAAPASSGSWQKVSAQFTVPVGASSVSIFQVIAKVGYVQSDDFSLTEYQPAQFNRGIVSLTFDDGWRTIYTNGLPLLQKYNMVSTQYLLTGTIDYPDYMTVAMMQAFKDQGSQIASHTINHPHLTQLSVAQIDNELGGAQSSLRSWFGTPGVADDFATPYGEYNTTVLTEIKKYYRSHRSTDVGFNSKDNFDIYNIKVQNITNTTTPAQVKAWVDQAVAEKTWLVLVYHEVDANAADPTYAVTPANLDQELNLIKQSGISVQTVAQAINEIQTQL